MNAKIAWTLAILTALLVAADIAIVATFESLASRQAVVVHGFPFVDLAVMGCGVMGALVISRYPRHPIGWLLALVGFTSAISLPAEAYSIWVIDHDGPGTREIGGVSAWLSTLLGGQVSIALIAILFLVAPDGHYLSKRWRYAAWASIAGAAFCSAAVFCQSPISFDTGENGHKYSTLAATLFSIGFVLVTIGLLASLVAMLLRLRASVGDQRRQLRLVATSATLLVLGVLVLAVVQSANGGHQTWASTGLLFISYAAMPILFAVAVLRYRLYEIDIIINRAVIIAVATVFAGVGYVLLVVAVGANVDARTSGFWVSLGATAVVALAFQPLRRGVVRLANRLAYGPRAAPYLALSTFSRRLAETPSSSALLPAVAEAAGRAVGAASAEVTLELAGQPAAAANWSLNRADGAERDRQQVQIGDNGVVFGTITVSSLRGRTFRAVDIALLQDLADQASQAFRNSATEARLADQVAALDRATGHLADVRRRIVEADDAARVRLEAAIMRDVVPRLTSLPDDIAAVRTNDNDDAALATLARLVDETNTALDSLREITSGVFPTQLSRAGLGSAVRTLLARHGVDGNAAISDSVASRRFSPRVEVAAYFCIAEVLRASARPTRLELSVEAEEVHLVVEGIASAEIDQQAIVNRVEAAGGQVRHDAGALIVSLPATVELPTPR